MKAEIAQPVSQKDLELLPYRAIIAFALRAAWRVQPFVRSNSPADRRGAAIAALVVARQIATGVDRLADRSLQIATAAGEANSAAAANAAYAAANVNIAGEYGVANVDTEDVAANVDYNWLLAWSQERRAADGIVPMAFFQRPLFEGFQPPQGFDRAFDIWAKGQYEAGLDWLPEDYQAMLSGELKKTHWAQEDEFLDDWLARDIEEQNQPAGKQQAASSETGAQADPVQVKETEAVEDDAVLSGGTPEIQAEMPSRDDHLSRRPLVETLADILSYSGQPPQTIALMGDWGSGKSSVVEQLQDRLFRHGDRSEEAAGKAHYLFSEFNAWEYEQTASMRAGLAQEVVTGLTRDMGWWAKFRLAQLNARKTHGMEFYLTLVGIIIALLAAIYGVSLTQESDTKSLAGTGILGGAAFLLLRFWSSAKRLLAHPLAEELKTYLQLPNYGEHLGEVPAIKKELKTLCEARLSGENDRLLIVVDDLDRCGSKAITDTFDAVRLVIDPSELPKIVVIIAVDDRIAFRALARHYAVMEVEEKEGFGRLRISRSKEEIARDYLSKIVQLPIRLDAPSTDDVRHFVKAFLMPVDAEKETPEMTEEEVTSRPPSVTAAAQELIDEERLDVSLIHGEGRHGDIRLVDVQRYLKSIRREAKKAGIDYHDLTQVNLNEASLSAASEKIEPEVSPEKRVISEDELEQVMAFESDEQLLFADLVAELGLSNPRQLIRLKNSYLVIKRYTYARESNDSVLLIRAKALMTALCWYEYLYQCGARHRHQDELVIWLWPENLAWHEKAQARMADPDLPVHQRLSPSLYMARRFQDICDGGDYLDCYVELMASVEMVVLPNAERGIIKSASEAEAIRAKNSDAEEVEIDPFSKL